MSQLRVWVEERPRDRLRFTWQWQDAPDQTCLDAEQHTVAGELSPLPGVNDVEIVDDGIELLADPGRIRPVEIAGAIRTALNAAIPVPPDPSDIRVWAEILPDDRLRLTWQLPEEFGERSAPADRRAVSARLSAQPGVSSVTSDVDGVVLACDPDQIERAELAALVRTSLTLNADLRSRAEAMLRRSTAYANLARTLALDERVSPIPDAARQVSAGNRQATPAFALRMLPGYTTIRRIQMMAPVIKSLSAWSRNAPPDVVDQHLASAGLTREILAEDYITSLEVKLFAREIGAEKAGQAGKAAAGAAVRALDYGRAFVEKQRQQES